MSFSRNSNRSPYNQQAASKRLDNLEVIEFSTGEGKIRLNKKNTKSYNNQTRYDVPTADNPDVWHMVIVHHDGKFKKAQIIEKLFAVGDHVECYIVGYRQGNREDYFLIRLCRQFIARLFYRCLKFKMASGPFLYLTVKLNVADYKSDQIHHITTFEKAFTERCNHYQIFEGVAKVLDLDNFAQSPEFAEMIFTLANKSSLALLCSTITKHCDIFKVVNGIRLSNNDIMDLTPFAVIPAIDVQLIDLRNNKINDVTQFKHLRKMNATELLVANNPITITDEFISKMQEMLPNIVKIDGKYTRNTLPSLIHLGSGENVIEVVFQGDTIKSDESLPPHLFRKYKTSDMWHQVIVNHNGKYSKNEMLFAIFSSLNSHELYPCYYTSGPMRDTFFIRNCFEQMEFLYLEKLKVRIPNSNEIVTLTFKMNVANFKREQIDPVERIQKAIEASFNLTDKCLNFERFASKPELNNIELIFNVPKVMSNILLKGARSYTTNIETLILSDNGLDSARGMLPLTWMKSLNSIDLSKNKIQKLADIENFPKISNPILDVKLNDNPLCDKYRASALEYIIAVKKIFPNIQRLDGRNLSPDGCCVPQKNYLCSIDTYDLTEQFVKHYFSCYDSVTRASLNGLYSKKAMFSISSNFSGLTSKNGDTRIHLYQSKSRSVFRVSLAAMVKSTYYGVDDIRELFKSLPQTKHDFQSFTIDVTYFSPMIVVLKVNGLFKEQGNMLNDEDLILGFARTFVLKREPGCTGFFGQSVQYSIINELLLLHQPSVYQIKNCFQAIVKVEVDSEDERLSSKEKECMVAMFQELTRLVPLWCIRCLDQSSWNFKNAIDVFTSLCDDNKVPDCAFNFNST